MVVTKTSSFVQFIVSRLLWIVIGWLIFYILRPAPEPIYETVIVPIERIIEREPDTIRTFVDRIVYVQSEPTLVSIAPGGAKEQVQEFCKPVTLVANSSTGQGEPVDPMLLLRSVSYNRRWAWRKDHLLLTGIWNVGDLSAYDYGVRGDWTSTTQGQSGFPLVQYPRTSLLYDIWEGGTQIYAVYKFGEFLFGLAKN